MAKKKAATAEEDLKRDWYNRWKEGFSWFDMANTLRTSAYIIRAVFLSAKQDAEQDLLER